MSAHFVRSRTADNACTPYREGWCGKVARHIAACILLLVAVQANGRGIIVGCLQQYQQRWGFVRMAASRAAWPHALHDNQQQQQQREK